MFRVVAPVVIHPTAEARQALGEQLRPAGLAAWREITRQGRGLEFAHLAFCHAGIAWPSAPACGQMGSSSSSLASEMSGPRAGSSPPRRIAGPPGELPAREAAREIRS